MSKSVMRPAYPSLATIQPYQAGKPIDELSLEFGITDIIKLASNENPLGCSPTVTLAITSKLGALARYPDSKGCLLKQALSDYLGVSKQQITLGHGLDDLLYLIPQTFVNCNDSVVYAQYSSVLYPTVTKIVGATAVEVPAKHFGHDLPAMLSAVLADESCRLVFISNPNNPTGALLSNDEIREFVAKVPSHILVVINEAYIEYTPENHSISLLESYDNVIILRSFSKAYGLAGLRVGYALSSPQIAEILNNIRQPFNVNSLALSASEMALYDQDFIAKTRALNHEQKQSLYKGLDSLGLAFVKSSANFVMVNVGDAENVFQELLEQGVIVRPLTGFGLPEWIRVSIGLPEENRRFLDTLAQVLA